MEPKQFWNKFLKVVMVIGIIIGGIASIVAAVRTTVWWIAPIGWIATFLSFSVLGLAIETSENISTQVKLLNTIVYLISQELEHSTDYIPDTGSVNLINDPYSLNKDSSDSVQKASDAAPTTRNVYEKKGLLDMSRLR